MTARRTQRGAGAAPGRRTSGGNPPGMQPTTSVAEPELRSRVFVYGTLLTGESNHHHLAYARLVGEARTRPEFTLFDLGFYPGMVRVGTSSVVGEIYAVDEPTLARLDRLEGHPTVYLRTTIHLASGDEVETYLLEVRQVAGCPIIPGGSWRARKRP